MTALPDLTPETKITFYGPPGSDTTQILNELIKFRGLSANPVPVNSIEDINSLRIMDRLIDAGVADSPDQVNLPFLLVEDRFVTYDEFLKALEKLPLSNVFESPYPYMVVYGVQNCPYSLTAIRELESSGLKYELRDVNDPRYRARFSALLLAHKKTFVEWPVMDVNGHLLIKPSMDEVRRYYR